MKKILSSVSGVTLLFAVSTFAQMPVLGELSKFVFFSADGAIGNTQRSQITSEVDTNVGAVTNFGNVDGVIHFTPDGSTGAAAVALENFKGLHSVLQNYIYVKTVGAAPSNGSLKLYSLDGKLVSSQIILLTREMNIYKVEKPAPKGTYLIQLESNGTRLYNKKVFIF